MFNDDVLIVLLRRSKTGQEGQGRKVGIPALPHSDSCPVRAARAWLDASGISSHPGFSSMPGGKDAGRFAGHSLRAGFCDSRANGGASIRAIMRQTGHRSLATVMRYIRKASLFRG